MILLIAILSILILLIVSSMYSMYKLFNLKDIYELMPFDKILLSEIYDTLKTGDIILLRSTLTPPIADIFMSRFIFKHVGMILKIDNNIYITESSNGNTTFYKNNNNKIRYMPNGININPLLTRLKYYGGIIYISRLNKKLSIEDEYKLISLAKDMIGVSYPSMFYLYMNFVLGTPNNKSFHCYKYVYTLLAYINLPKNNKLYSGFELADFITNITTTPFNTGYQYSKIYQLLYDVKCFF